MLKSGVNLALILTIAALLGGYVLVQFRAAAREAAAEAAFPPEGQFVQVGDRRVHALVRGSGPDVVLIHGAGGNIRDFSFDLIDRLADRYRVIAFDRPGFGYTDRARDGLDTIWGTEAEDPAEQAALLQAAAAALGAERPIVVGHSYGGAVGLAWAVNHPDHIAAYVSLAGVAMPWEGGLGWFYSVLGSAPGGALLVPPITAFATPSQQADALIGVFAPQPVPEGYAAHFGTPLTLRRETLRANARQVNTVLPFMRALSARYDALTLPIEILHGEADQTVPLSVHSLPLSQMVPSAHLTTLPGTGHMPHHADPQAAIDAIDRAASRANLRSQLR